MAKTGKEIYPYLLTKFTNKYINPEFMGQDKVFVYLFENFYAKGDTALLNPASRKTITERAYSLMANQLGQQAPVLNLTDTTGKRKPLYDINGQIWDLEADIRNGKEGLLGLEEVGRRALKIRDLNAERIRLKNEIAKEHGGFVEYKHNHASVV